MAGLSLITLSTGGSTGREGQKRHRPMSNMAMLMLLRRMKAEGVTVHGFRSTFRDRASEVANAPREVAEMSLSHKVGSNVEPAYARSDLLDRRRVLMERWSGFAFGVIPPILLFVYYVFLPPQAVSRP